MQALHFNQYKIRFSYFKNAIQLALNSYRIHDAPLNWGGAGGRTVLMHGFLQRDLWMFCIYRYKIQQLILS